VTHVINLSYRRTIMSEQRTFIEPTEIAGVEFGCPKCGLKILYPLTGNYTRLVDHCPTCDQTLVATDPTAHPSFSRHEREQIANLLTQLRNITQNPAIKAHVRIHITGVNENSSENK
jgi:hypothetical protein